MGSLYLKPSDFARYGIDTATAAEIAAASALVDTYINRPEGLVYVPDIDGNPAYMAALEPTRTIKAAAQINVGTNIRVALAANVVLGSVIGEAVVLDRDNALMELCSIVAADATSITLRKTVRPHSANCKIEFGLAVSEVRNLPSNRSISRVSHTPLMRIASACGKYEYGRRSDQYSGMFQEANLLATVQAFGGSPPWIPFDSGGCDYNSGNGEVWIPAGLMLAYYSQVQFWYISGYLDAPQAVKSAVASVVLQGTQNPEMSGNVRSYKAGDTQIVRFRDSLLDADTKKKLDPYKVRAFF